MLINNNHQGDYMDKMQKCQENIEALEEERSKIQVFQRELPLCLEIVTQAIEAWKQQLSGVANTDYFHGQSECSEQTSGEAPVMEEFIPIKRSCSSGIDYEQLVNKPISINISCNNQEDGQSNDKSAKKLDWLRSVQLWNQAPDLPMKEESPRKVSVVEVKKNGSGGAFHPFKREESIWAAPVSTARSPSPAAAIPAAAASSTVESGGNGGGGSKKGEKEGQSQRKPRRCWSPELHRRFLQGLQQLGGSHVATPKQIRELMKVDGLTNDEVKSHLQKYRLHTRRPGPSVDNNSSQAPQFVVVGGIWVQPPDYAAVATTAAASGEASTVATPSGIYAPIAALPSSHPEVSASINQRQQHKQSHADEIGSHSEGRVHSNSPATSSSTHTTTSSPSFS